MRKMQTVWEMSEYRNSVEDLTQERDKLVREASEGANYGADLRDTAEYGGGRWLSCMFLLVQNTRSSRE